MTQIAICNTTNQNELAILQFSQTLSQSDLVQTALKAFCCLQSQVKLRLYWLEILVNLIDVILEII